MEKLKENRIYKILFPFAVAFLFLFTERTLRYNFLFSCTYRMQTVSTYLPILCSWFIFAAFIVFAVKRRLKFSWGAVIPYALIYAGYLVSTLANDGNMTRLADAFIYSLPPFLLAVMMFQNRSTAGIYIKAATWIFVFMAAMNLLFRFVPQMWTLISEWREECFLGYHTEVGWPLTLGMLFALLDKYYNKRTWLFVVYAVLFFTNIAVIRPGGAVVGALIIAFGLALPFLRKIFNRWNLAVFLLLVLLLFAVLMWGLEPFVNFPPVKLFVENVLNKDITLSGRLYVWRGALEHVLESPVIGHGIQNSSQIFFEPSEWNGTMVHAHNLFLQTWYEGGLITLLIAFGMLAYTTLRTEKKCLKPSETECSALQLSGIFKLIIFAVLVMFQSDQDVYYNWYLTAFICHLYIISLETFNEQQV